MLRRVEAANLTEALSRARSLAGPRAIVVGTKRVRDGVVLTVATEPGSDELEQRLISRGVRRSRRARLLEGLAEEPGFAAREQALLERIEALMAPSDARGGAGQPRVLGLVGPTGVGKTTTIAKLAGRAQLAAGMRVGLVTLDLYRVAAVDQLRAYAELLGAPLQVASTPGELRAALQRFSRHDLVLIDTAGRSPTDERRMAELAALFQAAPEAVVWLVLSATTRLEELRHAVASFGPTNPKGMVLTKLDEAVVTGDVLELLARTHLPLRLVTAGQEVPDDLEEPVPSRLAAWVLGGVEVAA